MFLAANNRKRTFRTFMCLALWLAFATATAATNQIFLPLKANRLIGLRVENDDGQDLGKLNDLVMDMRTGKIQFVLLVSGGFWGVGAKLKAVPPQIMSAATAKRDTLAITVTQARWQIAPVCKVSNLAALADAEGVKRIGQFYGVVTPSSHPPSADAKRRPGPAGHETNQPVASSAQDLKLASSLIGKSIINRQQEKIGEVVDLLVSLGEPRPSFAIISAGKLFRDREHDYAVPLRAFTPTSKKNVWMINATRASLERSPGFNQEVWEKAASKTATEIYRYQKTEDAGNLNNAPPTTIMPVAICSASVQGSD